MAKFLVFGAGLVAKPMVEYLARRPDNQITLVGYTLQEAENIAQFFPNVFAMQADVRDSKTLDDLIGGNDIVVSLVPASFHINIVKSCIKNKIHMVTASYQSVEMLALKHEIEKAGIIVINEIGLDPGIDHLAAMQIIDKVKANDDEIESFVSWCGGIPAVESNDNPLMYKFSWEPRGAIMVLLNDAMSQKNNKTIKIEGEDLMKWRQKISIEDLPLECYPNRVSINYKSIYGIDNVKDIIRGTLRYQGFCDIFSHIKKLGLMQTNIGEVKTPISWKNYILKLNDCENIEQLMEIINEKSWQALNWLGIFSDNPVPQNLCSIDALCELLLQKLPYKKGERDMVVLQHKFVIAKKDGTRTFLSSTLKQIGEPDGYSAMAKTVGYPVAIVSQMIADNKIKQKGLLMPVTKEIYKPMLKLLEKEDIIFNEKRYTEAEMNKQEFLAELY